MRHKMKFSVAILAVIIVGLSLFFYKNNINENTVKDFYVNRNEVMMSLPDYKLIKNKEAELKNIKAEAKIIKEFKTGELAMTTTINKNELLKKYDEQDLLIKKKGLELQLKKLYDGYVRKYAPDIYLEPAPVDRRIVNLQLELLGLDLNSEEKRSKEAELAQLLESRTPSLQMKDFALIKIVREKMKKEQYKVEQEYNYYREQLLQENKYNYDNLTTSNDEKVNDMENAIKQLEKEISEMQIKQNEEVDHILEQYAKENNIHILENNKSLKNITKQIISQVKNSYKG